MTLWTPTKQPRNGRLLNPRLSSDRERLNRRGARWMRQGWTLHYVYDARAEEITRRREGGRRRTRRGAKWIRYCYYPGERRKFCPVPPVTLRALSPRFNAATNSSLTRPRNKLARKFELFRVGRGEKGIDLSVAKEKRRGLKRKDTKRVQISRNRGTLPLRQSLIINSYLDPLSVSPILYCRCRRAPQPRNRLRLAGRLTPRSKVSPLPPLSCLALVSFSQSTNLFFLCRLIKLVWHISNCRHLISSWLDLLQGTRRIPLLLCRLLLTVPK